MDVRPVGLEGIEDFEASLADDLSSGSASVPIGLAQSVPPADGHARTVIDDAGAGGPSAPLSSPRGGSPEVVAGVATPPSQAGGSGGAAAGSSGPAKGQDRWVGKRLSHFRIMRVMGEGTMGVVFQVEDVNLRRIAALKVLRRKMRGTDKAPQVDRFLLEARVAAALDHPCIAQIYEINEHCGWWYIAMEFLEGSSLQHLLNKAGPTPPGQAALMFVDAARGLAAAHEAGVIHRDVKPANLMLTRRGRCKLVDFGLVKLDSADNPFQDDDCILGTPLYIAPEVVQHKGATAASDVYSLSASLFTMLTGTPVFRGASIREVMRQHVEAEPPDVRSLAPQVSVSLSGLIRQGLSKIPEARPTAEAFAASLQAEVAGALSSDGQSSPSSSGLHSLGPSGAPSWSTPSKGAASATSPNRSSRRLSPFVWVGAALVGVALVAGTWLAPRSGPAGNAGGPVAREPAPSERAASASAGSAPSDAPGQSKTGDAAIPLPRPMITNSIGMRLALIPGGTFTMGSPSREAGRQSDERAVETRLPNDSSIGTTEVTQAQWAAVMGAGYEPPEGVHPNDASGLRFIGPELPAYASWFEASEFARRLSLKENKHYRLPTEAEWERACRAGSSGAFGTGDALDPTGANIDAATSGGAAGPMGRPMPVGSFSPNAWGLYDMHGNVMEWCSDWWGARELGPLVDPRGPAEGELKVLRGGSWDTYASFARSANRWANYPVLRTDYVGFRVVLDHVRPMPTSLTPYVVERASPAPVPGGHSAGEAPHHAAAIDPALPSYEPQTIMDQRLRSVGSDTMDRLMQSWAQRFRGWHPGVEMRHEGKGSGTAVRALMEGFAHLGPMSRTLKDAERAEFRGEHGYEPTQLVVAVDALALYVHASNPLAQRGLTLAEADAMFGTDRKRGFPRPIDRWGDLGLPEPWKSAPIALLGRNPASGTFGVFEHDVLRDGPFRPGMIQLVGSAEVVERVGADRFAIGFSGIGYIRADVASVPLGAQEGGPATTPGPDSVHDGTYPLVRPLYLTLDLAPGAAVTPLQREFLRFVYSKEGQQLVAEAGYFPLNAVLAREQLARIGLSAGEPTNAAAGGGQTPTSRPK